MDNILYIKDVIREYNKPGRHYHNFDHILFMYLEAEQRSISLTDEQFLAIMFHDVIYVPGKEDNEVRSVEFMRMCIGGSLSQEYDEIITDIILSTKHHEPLHYQAQVVIDLDLINLASSWKVYKEIVQKDRWEHHNLSDEEFKERRKKFLEKYIAKEKLFYSEFFSDNVELKAKRNLKMELEQIKKGRLI